MTALLDDDPIEESAPAREGEVACTFTFDIVGVALNREAAGLAFERLRNVIEGSLSGFPSIRQLEIVSDAADYEKVKPAE